MSGQEFQHERLPKDPENGSPMSQMSVFMMSYQVIPVICITTWRVTRAPRCRRNHLDERELTHGLSIDRCVIYTTLVNDSLTSDGVKQSDRDYGQRYHDVRISNDSGRMVKDRTSQT